MRRRYHKSCPSSHSLHERQKKVVYATFAFKTSYGYWEKRRTSVIVFSHALVTVLSLTQQILKNRMLLMVAEAGLFFAPFHSLAFSQTHFLPASTCGHRSCCPSAASPFTGPRKPSDERLLRHLFNLSFSPFSHNPKHEHTNRWHGAGHCWPSIQGK